MGSRFPSHQLSNGLYVSGRPEQPKEKPPTMSSTAMPYTGGDIKKSGELGKMFDIHVEKSRKSGPINNAPTRNASFGGAGSNSGPINTTGRASYSGSLSTSNANISASTRQKSNSGPLNRHGDPMKKSSGPLSGGGTPMSRQNSAHLTPILPTTGLITSGPISSGPSPKLPKIKMTKIIEKVENALADDDTKIVYSFEYFTPKPGHATVDTYIQTVSTMNSTYKPLFCDITWRPRDPYPALTLDLAGRMQNEIGVDTMMHLTCVGMPREKVDYALDTAKEKGVRNILALRGDFLPGMEAMEDGDGFKSGLDLVKYIRSKHGDYFGICVAGYPEAHPSQIPDGSETATEEGYKADLEYLKKKVDAGADFIITQLFFDADVYVKFVKDCRRIGITCPIVPGILPITTYRNFKFMTETCKTKVPKEVREAVEAAKGDDAKLAKYGVELATEICRKILKETGIRQLHFYTMNRDAPAAGVLKNLGLIDATN